MKKCNVILVLLLFVAVVSVSQAELIQKVQLTSLSGVSASYDHTTGTTSWSQGASGWLMTSEYNTVSFTNVSMSGTFSGAVDTSSGGLASAIFNSGTWNMHLEKGELNIDIAGHSVGNYVETEGKFQAGHIDGRGIVIVDSATFSLGDYGWGAVQLNWEGGTGSQSGLIADIALPNGGNDFGSYATDNYNSTNSIISLWADESVVPEPATLCLLGLGGLGLLRRRRA